MRAWLLMGFVFLMGCAVAEAPQPVDNIPPDSTLHEIYITTMRDGRDQEGLFGADRVDTLLYGRATVAVPSVHEIGVIERPRSGQPDPAVHFALKQIDQFTDGLPQFQREIASEAPGERVLFVHGYNMTVSDAILQATQIKHDFQMEIPMSIFAWPSAGDVRAYVYDRDSVLYSRPELVKTIKDLAAASREPIMLLGHSMGGLLTMEALRQIALQGDRRTLQRIAAVILVAPDLEPDVFRRQIEALGDDVPQPFVIFAATNDGALRISSFLTRRSRLGSIQSAEQLEGLPVTLLDLTDLGEDGELNHDVALTSPTAIEMIRGVRQGDAEAVAKFEQYLVVGGSPRVVDGR
ncbi:MAG: alpha/beta fold hydrolase [Pseudomonadota bacterium]